MMSAMRGVVSGAATVVVLLGMCGPTAHAANPMAGPGEGRTGADRIIKVPAHVSVSGRHLFGKRAMVSAEARIPVYRRRDDGSRQADRVVVYTEVISPRGLRRGPREIADLDGRTRTSQGASARFARGTVTARIPLTTAQRKALATMRRAGMSRARIGRQIHVVVEHLKDVLEPGPTWEHVGMAAGFVPLGKWVPKPGATSSATVGGVRGNVILRNTTDAPLTVLAGPTSCVYDSLYDYDSTSATSDQASQLGTLNGRVLDVGKTFAVAVEVNHNVYSNQVKTNDYGRPVLEDYAKFLGASIHDARLAGATDLPAWRDADGDADPSVEIDKELGEFVSGSLKNLLEATGLWDEFVEGLAEEGMVESALIAESVAAVDSMFETFGPLIAIAEMLYELFTSACSSNDGYAIIGATDAARPWRQFAQVYDLGSGHDKTIVPRIPPNTAHPTSVLTSLSNGLVSNSVPYQPPAYPSYYVFPFWDVAATNYVQDEGGGQWSWNFAYPQTQASGHAQVSIDPGTRRVHCSHPEIGVLTAQMHDLAVPVYMPAWPQLAWLGLDGSKASQPAPPTQIMRHPTDYLVGQHFIAANDSTASVRYTAQSSDPDQWSTIAIPAGQDWVDLPAGSKAVWVGCDIQVPEVFPNLVQTGRYTVMGTQIPSDVIAGPENS